MTSPVPSDPVLPKLPVFRPMGRFWPYGELSEQPSAEELADIHPELRQVLFGAPPLPFSMSVVFPAFEGPDYARAVTLAKASDEYTEFVEDGVLHHRGRFFPATRPLDLRHLYEMTAGVVGADVLIDDQPLPFARELWLPLVWMLIC